MKHILVNANGFTSIPTSNSLDFTNNYNNGGIPMSNGDEPIKPIHKNKVDVLAHIQSIAKNSGQLVQ